MKSIVISGVTSGIGTQWLYQLDEQENAIFFVLARNKEKFAQLIRNRPLRNSVHFIHCDFSSLASVHTAADKIVTHTTCVDVVVNNAGIWGKNRCISFIVKTM